MMTRTAPSTLRCGVIEKPAELAAIEAAWWALWRRCPDATPFESPAWLLPWCEHLAEAPLRVCVVHDGGDLRAVWPLVNRGGTLSPVGVPITDRHDALIEPADAPRVVPILIAALRERGDWRTLDLPHLPADSPLIRAEFPGWAATQELHDVSPALPLGPGGIPAAMVRRLGYDRRRAGRSGLTLEAADRATLDEWLQSLFELHAARWSMREQPGVLGDPAVQAFHRAAAARMLDAGLLRFYGLRAEGRPAACLYAFGGARRWCYYLGGFDPSVARFSPGALLIGHAIEEARQEGAAVFDFLRGGERYKYDWGAADQPLWRRRIVRDPGGGA